MITALIYFFLKTDRTQRQTHPLSTMSYAKCLRKVGFEFVLGRRGESSLPCSLPSRSDADRDVKRRRCEGLKLDRMMAFGLPLDFEMFLEVVPVWR